MKYLTKDLYLGKFSNSKSNRILKDYDVHFNAIIDQFPRQFVSFISKVSLNDAIVDEWNIDKRFHDLVLNLIVGEESTGYYLVKLVYSKADITEISKESFRELAGSDAELIYDEIDMVQGFFVHRMLFWPNFLEVEIHFQDFRMTRKKLRSRFSTLKVSNTKK